MPIVVTTNPKPKGYAEKKVVGKFKLLRGRHTEHYAGVDDDGKPYGSIIYTPGETFESKSDLRIIDPKGEKFQPVGEIDEEAHKFNVGGHEPAYEARDRNNLMLQKRGEKQSLKETAESEDYDQGSDNLQDMTVPDLRELAGEEEIDIGGAHKKADLVAAIRQARASRGDVP